MSKRRTVPAYNARAALCALAIAACCFVGSSTLAFNPSVGDWSKDGQDIRVMTWNVRDGIRTTISKTEGLNTWTSLARIVASLKPDVLVLQETGDLGCSGCVDSITELNQVLNLFLHGGTDPFQGGTVTAYVQKYAPAYDLPIIFVSNSNDGFNRNIILSRYPFADLNGDTKATISDIPLLLPDAYAPGGNGGIRGFAFAEIDLPNAIYTGNLVMGNAHLKSGSASSDLADRLEAAQNVAYVIDYWFNGAGLGTPDPNAKIIDNPPANSILSAETPVVIAGDWNEDEQTNNRRGPALWLTAAATDGGTDGTDRNRSDMLFDSATHFFTGSRNTLGGSKLDYIAIQDSIGTFRRAFVFNTSGTPAGAIPPEFAGYSFPSGASSLASDHFPVIADFILPLQPTCIDDLDCDDGLYCNGSEVCSPEGQCLAGSPPSCDDAIACTLDSCDLELDNCSHVGNHQLCDNGAFCDGAESCTIGVGCTAGNPPCGVQHACREENDSCIAIPAVSTWGACIMAILVLIVGTMTLRTRAQ